MNRKLTTVLSKCLFYTFNFKVSKYVLVSLKSFIDNNKNFDIKLYAYNFTDEQKKEFESNFRKLKCDSHVSCDVKIIYKDIKIDIKIFGIFKDISNLLFEKFKHLYQLKKTYDLIIYADPDVIFRKSVNDIEDFVEQDPGLYAVRESDNLINAYITIIKKKCLLKNYYNCGFLVLNSDIDNFSREKFNDLNNFLGRFNVCPEQNYMNYFYKMKNLKDEHNYLWSNKLVSDPISVHYNNFVKPWTKVNFETLDADFIRNYSKITKFFKDYHYYEDKIC